MPAGLDGNPDPIVTPARTQVLSFVAEQVARESGQRVLVGIDGRSATGKSTFADELGRTLEGRGHNVIRSTTDLFHRPRHERLRLGASSANGYYLDSHQLLTIVDALLVPFRSGAAEVLVGAFDEPSDQPKPHLAAVPASAVLVFDGLFVRRPELRDHFDVSIVLHAQRRCDEAWLAYLEDGLPVEPTHRAAEIDRRLIQARWPRYRAGWELYLDTIGHHAATIDIDNNDLSAPFLITAEDDRQQSAGLTSPNPA